MLKVKISQITWDSWNVNHISKHKVTPKEVEESIINALVYRKGYHGRSILVGRCKSRILSVVLAKEEDNKYYIVTARDADKKERRLLYEKEKQKNSSI